MKKVALLFVLFGIFLPFITLPLSQGATPGGGFLNALQFLKITIIPETRHATFADGPITGDRSDIIEVDLGGSGVVLEFPGHMNGSEITRAIHSNYYESGKLKLKSPTPARRHFVEWYILHEGVSIRYAYFVSFSCVLLFVGIVMILFCRHSEVIQPRRA